MKSIEFDGKLIFIDKICAISEVKTISTGSRLIDLEYGFEVIFDNNKINILSVTERYIDGNSIITREEAEKKAENKRQELINLIKQQYEKTTTN